MTFTMDEKWRTRVAFTGAFALGATAIELAIFGSDLFHDGAIDYPRASLVGGGFALFGIVSTAAMYILGKRAARAHMVDVHGEETVAMYERMKSA